MKFAKEQEVADVFIDGKGFVIETADELKTIWGKTALAGIQPTEGFWEKRNTWFQERGLTWIKKGAKGSGGGDPVYIDGYTIL